MNNERHVKLTRMVEAMDSLFKIRGIVFFPGFHLEPQRNIHAFGVHLGTWSMRSLCAVSERSLSILQSFRQLEHREFLVRTVLMSKN